MSVMIRMISMMIFEEVPIMSSVATVLSNQKLPIQLSGNDIVLLVAITALETVVMTAIMKDYSVEITGETTKEGTLKGGLKLHRT